MISVMSALDKLFTADMAASSIGDRACISCSDSTDALACVVRAGVRLRLSNLLAAASLALAAASAARIGATTW